MSDYLDLVGCRLLDGFDIAGRYALELPDVLLRSIRSSVDGAGNDNADVDARIAGIRSQVPEEHRAEFDELLGEARLMYRLRDERGVFSDIWASGIMRRAVLAAGRRLEDKGRVHDAEHFVDAGFDEMCALVDRHGWAVGRRARATLRRPQRAHRQGGAGVPRAAASPAARPRPGSRRESAGSCTRSASPWASCSAAQKRRTTRTCCAGSPRAAASTKGRLGASPGPTDFDRILQGDVLVTESTTEAFNILLPLLGAIVTDSRRPALALGDRGA